MKSIYLLKKKKKELEEIGRQISVELTDSYGINTEIYQEIQSDNYSDEECFDEENSELEEYLDNAIEENVKEK